MMKNTTTWPLCLRSAFARISGRMRIIAAPVVPRTLAINVPKPSITVFVTAVARTLPATTIPPETV
jgi:hypothetical protein